MAKHKITLLPGDGIGPEVTAAVVQIIECAGVDVEWEKYFVGAEALTRFGDPLPQEVLDSIVRNKVALKGRSPLPSAPASRRSTSGCARPSISTPTCDRSSRCPTSSRATRT